MGTMHLRVPFPPLWAASKPQSLAAKIHISPFAPARMYACPCPLPCPSFPFAPQALIAGGTFNGELYVWDLAQEGDVQRAKSNVLAEVGGGAGRPTGGAWGMGGWAGWEFEFTWAATEGGPVAAPAVCVSFLPGQLIVSSFTAHGTGA